MPWFVHLGLSSALERVVALFFAVAGLTLPPPKRAVGPSLSRGERVRRRGED
jgi:hypothetical protein